MTYFGFDFSETYKSLKKKWEEQHNKQLTQEEIGRETFITQPNISKLINGNRHLTADDVELFAKFFGVSKWEVITGISLENANIHEETGLNEQAILWLKENVENNQDRIDMLNCILEKPDIANLLFDALYNYAEYPDLLDDSSIRWLALKDMQTVFEEIFRYYKTYKFKMTEEKRKQILERYYKSRHTVQENIAIEAYFENKDNYETAQEVAAENETLANNKPDDISK